MQFSINYKEKETIVDIIVWESTMNDRVEYYAVFAEQQETFVNFVKRKDQPLLTEVSSSADLTAESKAVIKERLIYFIHHPIKF